VARTAAVMRKPKFLSQEYFLTKKEQPNGQYLYYFYILCYKTGLRTVSLFRRIGVFFEELFRFLFIRLLSGTIISAWRAVKAVIKRAYYKGVTVERKQIARQRQELAAIKEERKLLGGKNNKNKQIVVYEERINHLQRSIKKRVVRHGIRLFAPVLALILLVGSLFVWNSLEVALRVEYDGLDLGYIKNESVYDDAVAGIEDRIIGIENRYNFSATPIYKISHVTASKIQNTDQFVDTFLSAVLGDEVDEAIGVYIDGKFLLAVTEQEQLKTFMNTLLEPYHSDDENAVVGFLNDVTFESGIYPIVNIKTYDEAVAILGQEDTTTVKYTCVKNDTVATIATKNGLTEEALLQYNPEIESKIVKGKVLTLTLPEPFLPVKISIRTTYTETIPYDTTIKYSSSLYEGQTEITTSGRNGSQEVVADIIYVNGVEVSRDIISTTVTKEARNAVKKVGTKAVPKTAPSIEDFNGVTVTGKFMWPVDGGHITCGWLGYPGHYGLDIGAAKGTNIYASDGGIVVYVHYGKTSYGYEIVIDHGNGYETRYGHCSKILVEVGDKVEKGDVIGLVGSTGNSTGPHLHFEIIKDGNRINPKPFITG